jgi:hypothetical protein
LVYVLEIVGFACNSYAVSKILLNTEMFGFWEFKNNNYARTHKNFKVFELLLNLETDFEFVYTLLWIEIRMSVKFIHGFLLCQVGVEKTIVIINEEYTRCSISISVYFPRSC